MEYLLIPNIYRIDLKVHDNYEVPDSSLHNFCLQAVNKQSENEFKISTYTSRYDNL